MVEGGFLRPLLIFLAAAALLVAIAAKWRLPSALAYLLLGAALGPHALGWLQDTAATRVLAELGVVFLMFMVGLEFSIPKLVSARRSVVGMGALEVLLVGVAATAVGIWSGLPPANAAIVGAAIAMSSTAIVLKQLSDIGELHTEHGRLAVGVLVFQDIATLLILAALPALAGSDSDAWAVLRALGSVALAFGAVGLLGRWLIRPLIGWVAAQRSTELFMLVALLAVVGAAALSGVLGLSAPLGAFLAGLVLGESTFRHQLEADLHPFQSVLLGLFFASIGMLLDPRLLMAFWAPILSVLAGLVALKCVGVAGLVRVAGYDARIAWRLGAILAHGGEFSLLLISVALSHALLPPDVAQIVLAATVASMFLAPLAIHSSERIAKALSREGTPRSATSIEDLRSEAKELRSHIVICGFGRSGQNIARLLTQCGRHYVVLDLDPGRVRDAHAARIPVYYGDATRRHIIETAGAKQASAVVITFDAPAVAKRVIDQVRSLNCAVPILVRARTDEHYEWLLSAGATSVVPEELEGSLMLGARLLSLLGIGEETIRDGLRTIRRDHYEQLRRFYHPSGEPGTASLAYREELRAVALGWASLPRSVGELRETHPNVEVTALIRGEQRQEQPSSQEPLRPGDVLELCGPHDALAGISGELGAMKE